MDKTQNSVEPINPVNNGVEGSFLIAHFASRGGWMARAEAVEAAGGIPLVDHGPAVTDTGSWWLRLVPEQIDAVKNWAPRTLVLRTSPLRTDLADATRALRGAGHRVGVEVADAETAVAVVQAGAAFVVARGLEGGGFVSETSVSVLVRSVRAGLTAAGVDVPVVAWGGAGLDSTASLRLLGAAAVVLSDQLLLAQDAPTSAQLREKLEGFNPADTVQLGRRFGRRLRVYGQLGTRPPREMGKLEALGDEAGFWPEIAGRLASDPTTPNLKTELYPLGQDAALAVAMGSLGTTADIVREVIESTTRALAAVGSNFALEQGAGISSVNGTSLPIHQGPMAQTSDTPAFALAVAEAGGMPWLALGNMPPHIAEATIADTKALLGDLPFGAGIIGLDANPHRDAHIEIMARLRPAFALVAAGSAEQALTVESTGVPAYLHTPTPGLLRGALKDGCRRFILEGSEAGGHIGSLGGVLLWQLGVHAMLDAFADGVDPRECAFVPAGGIGDAPSGAAASAVVQRLHELGVRCGVQMGTAYLLTDDIVASGALSGGFQRCALDVRQTVLMGESVRTPTRVLHTAEADRVLARESQREVDGVALRTRKEAYEHDNLGGLRAAAKAQRIAHIDPERGAIFEDLTTAEQEDTGLFHAGQIVAVAQGTCSIADLHREVTAEARRVTAPMPLTQSLRAIEKEPILTETTESNGVAIIGVGAVLPGAADVQTFWDNLLAGRDAIGEIPKDRWDADLYFSEDRQEADKTYSRIGGFVRDFEFDRKAFRLPPTVAGQMDLTQKLALSATREALSDAGYMDRPFNRERTAVVVGAARGDSDNLSDVRAYFPLFNLSARRVLGTKLNGELEGVLAAIEVDFKRDLKTLNEDTMPGELDNIIAGRIASTFDLRGPNFTTDAACASSMAAIEVAVRGIQDGRFDMAVTGGVDCMMAPPAYIKFSKIGALSARHSAPFDVEADGFVMGEGAAILLLKREADAVRDGDRIYAVIRGIGGASDGKGKGITAPNPIGQQLAVQRALDDAGVEASSIGMVEAHGTGTRVGDRVEVEVLRSFYARDSMKHDVALGSVKSNIGHLKGASGAAGVVKAALAVHHGVIPPTLNVRNVNPALALEETPFYLPNAATAWPEGAPRRAGISSFGFGGTNFHVIVEAPGMDNAAVRPTAAPVVAVPVPVIPEAAAPIVVGTNAAVSRDSAYAVILDILCERTGYDADEIEADFELEADLGIDTVKQAEIMASVREHYGLARDESFRLADYPTLGHLAGYVVERAGHVPEEAPAQVLTAVASPAAPGVSRSDAYARILQILCERTGYDADEIEPDFELEADLGIDTVKQAEIMASVREHYGLERDEAFRLADYPTLGHLAGYVVERSGAETSAVSPEVELAPASVHATHAASEVVASTSGVCRDAAYGKILEILCERTGYDADEIEPDFELEADLGIDTVKQAEIMASVREHYGLARDEDFRLADFPTLGHLAGYVVARSSQAGTGQPQEAEAAAVAPILDLGPGQATGYAPLVLTAADSALLADAAEALCTAGEGDIDAARVRPGATPPAGAKVRLSVAAEDTETARTLLSKAAQALRKGKGLRALENRGVYVREIQPSGKVAFLFPGQGSQYAGMLEDLRSDFPIVEATFAEADAALADLFPKPLSAYMNPDGVLNASADRKSAEAALRQTQITQPAMVAADVAILRLLAQFGVRADVVGGHSLGEYAAAVAAGIMSFATGLRTVAARGDAMAGANPGDAGLMAAMAAPAAAVQAVLDTVDGYVVCANKNCQTQTVIAGSTAGVEEALARLGDAGIDGRLIPVSHAFHSKIVSGACGPLGEHLQTQEIKSPTTPIITNVTADYYPSDPAAIRDILTVQLASPVEFVKMVERMHDDGARIFVEVGPKRALTGFVGSILEGRTHRAYLSNHPKKGGRQTLRELLAALAAEGLLHKDAAAVDAQAVAVQAVAPAPVAPTAVPEAPAVSMAAPGRPVKAATSERPHIVISGVAVGLPGTERVFGDEDPYDAILSGRNLIGTISDENKRKVVGKNIRRLQKGPSGGEFVKVDSIDEVPQLAGMLGGFDLTADFGVPEGLVAAMDRASQLALAAGLDALRDAGLPMAPDFRVTRNGSKVRTGYRLPAHIGGRLGVIFASAFTGYDRLIEDVRAAALAEAGVGEFEFDRKFLLKVLGMGNAQVAEYIGARGPNTQMNSACASTTIALAMAEDWIRLGRADRVLIVGADDITTDGMVDWFTAGFLAAGAATTEADVTQAALPFDKRRNGMIVGAGAVALVVERNEDVVARGMEPVADVLATRIANSAFHPTRLNVEHIAGEVEQLIADAEGEHDLKRAEIAASTMFMSHETYTPARGGSAAAEISALRRSFGEAANQVVIANTKGFSGHPMAAGIEDAIALKALQRGKVPPIANFSVPDPDLGDLRLSDGSDVDVKYALRLAAGFGSQLGLALFGRRAQTEDRVVDQVAWAAWLARCADAQVGEIQVVDRNLRVVPGQPAPRGVERKPVAPVRPHVPAPTAPSPTVPAPAALSASVQVPTVRATSAPVSAPPVRPGMAAAPAVKVAAVDRAAIFGRVLEVLCDRTGYDADEVEPEFEMEADLGIDTVKQAEIMATVREEYGLARDETFRLADYPTLARLTDYVVERLSGQASPVGEVPDVAVAAGASADVHTAASSSGAVAAVAAPAGAAAVTPEAGSFAPRQVSVVATSTGGGGSLESLRGMRVLLNGEGGDVVSLTEALAQAGAVVVHGSEERFDAVLNVQTDAVDDETAALRTFGLAQVFKRSNCSGFFLTLTRAGGRFGFDGTGLATAAASAAGVTRSLARELPDMAIRTVDVDGFVSTQLARRVLTEALHAGEPDVGLRAGQRFVVADVPLAVGESMGVQLTPASVVLLTGGAGGITALVAKDIAQRFGCRLALLGRTPLTHPDPLTIDMRQEKVAAKARLAARGVRVTPMAVKAELRSLVRQREIALTVEDLRGTGAEVEYFAADLASDEAVGVAVSQIEARFGSVDVVVHGAGVEISRLAEQKSQEEFLKVFRGKARGAHTLWRLLGGSLKAFVGFSSVAGRYGNVGQTDYAAANGALARLIHHIDANSAAVGLCIDWTAWDDVGMATHGSMRDILTSRGVELLPAAQGAPMVADLLTRGAHGEVLVAGALGDLAPARVVEAVAADVSNSPLLDTVLAFEPGVRVTASRVLSLEADHFLRGHIYDGTALVPGVMGVELMAETAGLLSPELRVQGVDSVEFLRAIKLHRDEPVEVYVTAEADGAADAAAGRTVRCSVQTRRTTKTGRVMESEHYRCRVVLSPRVESAIVPLTIDAEQVFRAGPDKAAIYERMFHTGLFEVLERVPLVGQSAVLARGRQPVGPLTDGGRNEDIVAAPMVVEMALQAVGIWGMAHHAYSYLPVGIAAVRLHRAHMPGEEIALRVVVHSGSTERLRADVEAWTGDGQLLLVCNGIELIGHRPAAAHEVLALAEPVRTVQRSLAADEALAWLERLGLSTADLLSDGERASLDRLRSEQRRREWLAARVLAKDAAREHLRDFYGVSLALTDIEIAHRDSGEPYAHVRSLLHAGWDVALPAISITHSSGVAGVSIALGARIRPGLDFETIEARSTTFVRDNFEPSELTLTVPGATTEAERVTALWALKEAVTKALGKGLALSTLEVTTRELDATTGKARMRLTGEADAAYRELGGARLEAQIRLTGGFAVAEVCLICDSEADAVPAIDDDVDERIAAVAALLFHTGLLRPGSPS